MAVKSLEDMNWVEQILVTAARRQMAEDRFNHTPGRPLGRAVNLLRFLWAVDPKYQSNRENAS